MTPATTDGKRRIMDAAGSFAGAVGIMVSEDAVAALELMVEAMSDDMRLNPTRVEDLTDAQIKARLRHICRWGLEKLGPEPEEDACPPTKSNT